MRLGLFLLGAGVGAPTRYLIDRYFRESFNFPLGILVVNIFGSFLLGLVIGQDSGIALALIGFSGALTTWSAFALDLFNQLRWRELSGFLINLLANFAFGIGAVLLGLWIAG
jgi:CrcB protein